MSPGPTDKSDSNSMEKRSRSSEDEKKDPELVEVSVYDADQDEALRLVGKERTTEFSEEFNLKVRRK